MSLEGYKPLSFGPPITPQFLTSLQTPVDNTSITRTILQNSGWGDADLTKLKPTKNKTLISRIFDALSIGNYAMAGAADKQLSAIEESRAAGDNIFETLAKTSGAQTQGILGGVKASLKGTFGTDDVANDPTDKTHFMDVFLNHTDQGKRALDPYSGMSKENRKQTMMGYALLGLGADIALDPLTYLGGTSAPTKIKNLKEIPQLVEEAANVGKIDKLIPGEKNLAGATGIEEKFPGRGVDLKSLLSNEKVLPTPQPRTATADTGDFLLAPPVPKREPFVVSPSGEITPPGAVAEPTAAQVVDNGLVNAKDLDEDDVFASIFGMAPPEEAVEMPKVFSRLGDPARREKMIGNLINNSITKPSIENWAEHVGKTLTRDFPGIEFTKTNEYLTNLYNQAGKGIKSDLKLNPKGKAKFTAAMSKMLEEDFNAHRAATAGRTKKPAISTVVSGGAPKVSESDAIAKQVADEYRHQVETGEFGKQAMRNVEGLRHKISTGENVRWTGVKQVNMWNTIINRIPNKNYARALKILRQVEDDFIGAGHKPFSGTKSAHSVELRLSDVISKIGPEEFAKHGDLGTTILRSAFSTGEVKGAANAARKAPELKAAVDQAIKEAKANPAVATSGRTPIPLNYKPASPTTLGKVDNTVVNEMMDLVRQRKEMLGIPHLKVTYGHGENSPFIKYMYGYLAANPDTYQNATKLAELQKGLEQFKTGSPVANAMQEAVPVQAGVDAAAKLATGITNETASAARIEEAVDMTAKIADDIAQAAGAKTDTASQIIKEMFIKSDPAENAITNSSRDTFNALKEGKIKNYNSNAKVTRGIQATIKSEPPAVLAKQVGPAAKVFDWLGARFNTAYKNSDMRPIYLEQAASARSSVGRRAKVWNDATRQFGRDPELWKRAFQTAQGMYVPAHGTPEAELAKLIHSNIENLFGSSGIRTTAVLDNTVAGRSQLTMRELNENLKRYGIDSQFTNGKSIIDNMGREHNFSQGIDWLNSWQTWNIGDPLNFMMRVQNAVENTVREANMFNEMAARFGSYIPKGRNVKGGATVNHDRLAGYRFTPEIADQIETFIKNMVEAKKPNSRQMQLFDNVLSKWKAAVTIYMPSHHLRNLIGDTYMNWMAGVNDVSAYSRALKVMDSQSGRYNDVHSVGNLTNPSSLMEAMDRMKRGVPVQKGTNINFTMKNGQHVTNDMIYTAMHHKGLLPSARILEDIAEDSATVLDKFQPFGGRVRDQVHKWAEYREHYIRIAHFINDVKKSPKGFQAAIDDASKAVRKWHPDGMDLTRFERDRMRRIFPFYSWTRKAYPLVVESLVMRPGKVTVYPKMQGAAQAAIQGEPVNWADPFPQDQLFPDWLQEKGIGPLTGSGLEGYGIINPSNPTLDLVAQASDPVKGIGQMLNPLGRVPAELITSTEAATGAPITSYGDYATKQIPGISTVGRVTNVGLGGSTAKFDREGFNENALWNLITAAGMVNTGSLQKQGEFDLRDYLKNRGQ